MAVRYLSDPELVRLSTWPGEIAAEDAVTFFTLSGNDLSWIAGLNRAEKPPRCVGPAVCPALPWLGWIPDDLGACPVAALDRRAAALAIAPDDVAVLLAERGRRHILADRDGSICTELGLVC